MRLRALFLTRRSVLASTTVLGIAAAQRAFPPASEISLAQDATPEAIATPGPGAGTIQSTGVGPVPSTGASRPGPVSQVRERNIVATSFHPELAGETRFHRLVATMAAEHDDPGEGSGRRPHPTRRTQTR